MISNVDLITKERDGNQSEQEEHSDRFMKSHNFTVLQPLKPGKVNTYALSLATDCFMSCGLCLFVLPCSFHVWLILHRCKREDNQLGSRSLSFSLCCNSLQRLDWRPTAWLLSFTCVWSFLSDGPGCRFFAVLFSESGLVYIFWRCNAQPIVPFIRGCNVISTLSDHRCLLSQ